MNHDFAKRATRILLSRAGQALVVALAVSALCFMMVRNLPGDAAFRIAAARYGYDLVDQKAAEAVSAELGLDRSAWAQLASWLSDLTRLNFGNSLVTERAVTDEISHYLMGTLQLAAASLLLAALIGCTTGALAARRPGRLLDRLTNTWVAAVRSTPPFLLGLLLAIVLSAQLGLLPAVGHGGVASLTLPALTLGLSLSGLFARVTRDAVLEVRQSEYVRFAQTKGLSEPRVLTRHVVRNAAVGLVPYLGVQAVCLIEGVVVVESLFSWQGLGHALVHAVFWRDVPVLQATALLLALIIIAVNTLVDIAVLWLDPRPRRLEHGTKQPAVAP